jgi:hypothetical protein
MSHPLVGSSVRLVDVEGGEPPSRAYVSVSQPRSHLNRQARLVDSIRASQHIADVMHDHLVRAAVGTECHLFGCTTRRNHRNPS